MGLAQADDATRIVTRHVRKVKHQDIIDLVFPDGRVVSVSIPHRRSQHTDVILHGPADLVYGAVTLHRFDSEKPDA